MTAKNLLASGTARIGLGPTREVVIVDGEVAVVPMAELPAPVGDAFAAKAGFDPRMLSSPYLYFRVTPMRVQAWREVDELPGRLLSL